MLGLLYKDIRTNLKWLILALSIVLFFNAVMFSADVKSHDIDFIGMRAVYLLLYSSVFFTIAAFAINFIQTNERNGVISSSLCRTASQSRSPQNTFL